MDIGDRVVYIENGEIDLRRDAGTLIAWGETSLSGRPAMAEVLFDDGETWTVNSDELKPLVDRQLQSPFHLHFGCTQDPCPSHNSNRGNEG